MNTKRFRHNRRRSERGVSLLLTTVVLSVMLGMLGLVTDLGRMYIVKNELQSFVDASALAASFELDGTQTGLTRARNIAQNGPGNGSPLNRWNFAMQNVANVTTEFATALAGPFDANPANATGQRFIRVQVTTPVPVLFLSVIPNVPSSQNIFANAIGGQALVNSSGEGTPPFSPDAQNPADPNFGYTTGIRYTLKWAPPGQRNKPGGRCAGDLTFNPGGGSSDRGYIDVGQGNGNSALHDAIVNNDYGLAAELTIGSQIDTVPGNKHVGPAMTERFNQDTDTTSTTYADYNGNGRRLFVVPVNDGGDPGHVVGFGVFLIMADTCGNNNAPCCAVYVGNSGVMGSGKTGSGTPGLFEIKLMQ